jgi:hypothetical protein
LLSLAPPLRQLRACGKARSRPCRSGWNERKRPGSITVQFHQPNMISAVGDDLYASRIETIEPPQRVVRCHHALCSSWWQAFAIPLDRFDDAAPWRESLAAIRSLLEVVAHAAVRVHRPHFPRCAIHHTPENRAVIGSGCGLVLICASRRRAPINRRHSSYLSSIQRPGARAGVGSGWVSCGES